MPIQGQSPKEVVHTEMHKFKHKQLHSGSNKGPLVKDRKQAIAIALSESRRAGKKYSEGGEIKTHSINPMNDVTDPDVHPLGSAAGGPRASLHLAAKGIPTRPKTRKVELGAGDESKVYDKGDSADDESPAPDHKAGGGSTGNFNPERASAIGLTRQGMINSSVPGRTDKLNLNVPNGSYIIPADIPSAIGQGNSMAGSAILNKMFNSGPYGMNLSKGSRVAPRHSSLSFSSKAHFAGGGPTDDDRANGYAKLRDAFAANARTVTPLWRGNQMTDQRYRAGDIEDDVMGRDRRIPAYAKGGQAGVAPIVAAGGEYVIHPETVAQLGNGDLNLGHDILDQFVKQVREKHISTLKGLKPPKGSKK